MMQEILDTVQIGALATVNADRTPLVTPVHFARLDDAIVWVSDRSSRHSQNIFRSGKLEFATWDCDKRAVFTTTIAREATDDEAVRARVVYKEKFGDFMPPFTEPQFYIAPIGQLDENSTTGKWLHFVA